MAKLPEQIGFSRLEELTAKIRNGGITKDEETELVNGHLRLLESLANRWSVISPHLKEVFVADGMFALLLAIREAPTKLRGSCNLTQFIVVKIKSAFKKSVNQQHAVKAPLQDRLNDRVRTVRGKEYVFKKVKLRRLSLPNESEEDSVKSPRRIPSQLLVPQDRFDLREIIKLSTKSKFEEAVLKLKEHGYNRKEIAAMLKEQPMNITRTLETIEERLRSLLKD